MTLSLAGGSPYNEVKINKEQQMTTIQALKQNYKLVAVTTGSGDDERVMYYVLVPTDYPSPVTK